MIGIIDRFEGQFAVVELKDRKIIDIERNKLPIKAKEGDVINIAKKITMDYKKTKERKIEIEKATKDLWE